MQKKEKNIGGIYKHNKYNKSQVSAFIILAIVVVGGVILYLIFKGNIFNPAIPRNFDPIYNYYLSCIDSKTTDAARLLGIGGGYIENPEFSPGSEYMPFSSQLGFLGNGIPYWHYISGNGVVKEQVPKKQDMEYQINNYLSKNMMDCDFEEFYNQGFEIYFGSVKGVYSNIKENSIGVELEQDIEIKYGNDSWIGKKHSREVNSFLGTFYDLAKKIYTTEKDKMFLENYGVDILRLYAPVDGSEISCSPKIWDVNGIRERLMSAIEANTAFIKLKGNYYSLKKEENKYFIQDIGEKVDSNVNFLYQKNWPMKMEIWPSESGILKAEPIGNQQGMGILGFCYVPYHFVYDLAYPVLIQIYYDEEVFQFPVVVYIEKNKPRKGNNAEALPNSVAEICTRRISDAKIYTYNTKLEPVSANINYKCFETTCPLGRTKVIEGTAVLNTKIPQCVNGFIIANEPGYDTKRTIVKSINENNFQLVLDKKYKLKLDVKRLSDKDYAVITFMKDNKSSTVAYPEMKDVELTEGQYEIKAYVYSNASINLQGTEGTQKCIDAPSSGVLGAFGATEKKCFNMNIPSQLISYAVTGGGKENYYIAESELENSLKIVIEPEIYGNPAKIEDLQSNYNKIDNSNLGISFE
ncbi:MAG: hypothetical protein Q8N99_01240 [Nanoarchaeota archaeon]|nr:hypothetical protein [Nanoarchaeota archaeon]